MADNEEMYRYYRSKYYDACSKYNACDRSISAMQGQRRTAVNKVNGLEADIKKLKRAITNVQNVLNREDEVTGKLSEVSKKLDKASDNYSAMVKHSDVSSKNLNTVFSNESMRTRRSVSDIFNTVRSRKQRLESNLSDKQRQLKNAKRELDNLDDRIRREKSRRSEWKRLRHKYYWYMEYYS